ncbi:hypothetical protein JCM15519_06320 [Fundidesulfovibrio butyratiphilus]
MTAPAHKAASLVRDEPKDRPKAKPTGHAKPYRSGDRVNSARHQGELVVAVAGSRVLICSKCRKNGRPGRQEVVVHVDDVRCVRHMLPT